MDLRLHECAACRGEDIQGTLPAVWKRVLPRRHTGPGEAWATATGKPAINVDCKFADDGRCRSQHIGGRARKANKHVAIHNQAGELVKNQKQVRSDSGTEDELRLLGESLRERQLQPILALACGLIVFGHRRYWAAKLVGLESLEVIILDAPLSDPARQAYQLVENLQRAGLSDKDTYVGMAEWLCMNPSAELKDLAKALSLDPSTVTRYMSVSKLCPEALTAFNEGKLSISAAYAIAKRPASEQPGLLALRLSGQAVTRSNRSAVVAA